MFFVTSATDSLLYCWTTKNLVRVCACRASRNARWSFMPHRRRIGRERESTQACIENGFPKRVASPLAHRLLRFHGARSHVVTQRSLDPNREHDLTVICRVPSGHRITRFLAIRRRRRHFCRRIAWRIPGCAVVANIEKMTAVIF